MNKGYMMDVCIKSKSEGLAASRDTADSDCLIDPSCSNQSRCHNCSAQKAKEVEICRISGSLMLASQLLTGFSPLYFIAGH